MNQMFSRVAAPVLFLGLAAAPAGAGDGRIPVYEPGTIDAAGHYQLTRNIGGTIEIDANGVVLDLGGWYLSGITGVTIANGSRNVTVRNGFIASVVGVSVSGGASRSADIVVEDVSIAAGTFAIDMDAVDSVGIYRCYTESGGIRISGGGQRVTGRLIDNVIVNPGARGIELYNFAGGSVSGNLVVGPSGTSGVSGIYLASGSPAGGNLVADNVVRDLVSSAAADAGIYVASTGNEIRGNTLQNNQLRGIWVLAANNRVVHNFASENGTVGIFVSGDNNDVSDNTTLLNDIGLQFSNLSSGIVYDGNRSCQNTTSDLSVAGSGHVAGTNVICAP